MGSEAAKVPMNELGPLCAGAARRAPQGIRRRTAAQRALGVARARHAHHVAVLTQAEHRKMGWDVVLSTALVKVGGVVPIAAPDPHNPPQAVVVEGVETPFEGSCGHPALTAKQQD